MVFAVLLMTTTSCAEKKSFHVTDPETQIVSTVVAKPYGIFNKEDRVPGVTYEISWGNVFWAIVLAELVLIPTVIIIGWFLWEADYAPHSYTIPDQYKQ